MNDNGMNEAGMHDDDMHHGKLESHPDDDIQEDKSATADARVDLYQALSTVEDALADGYHSRRPLPAFAPEEPPQARKPQSSALRTTQYQTTQGQTAYSQRDQDQKTSAPRVLPTAHESLSSIVPELVRCRACRLAITRKQVVPGTGPEGAALFILGEYPSDEEKACLPFSLDSGALMARMLSAIGLDRQRNCFETTAVKCRPPMDRDPSPDELASCLPFLERQLLSSRPKAILAFGRIPAQILLGSKEALPRLRGRIHDWRGIPLVATYHPEAILKDESLKRPAWEDLKLLRTIFDDA
jgi:DNA polymerase